MLNNQQIQIQGVLREYEQAARLGAWYVVSDIRDANTDLTKDFDAIDLRLFNKGGK